jgi:transcription initiation factor IIE alpha subunit
MKKEKNFIKIYPSEVKKIGLHEALIISLIRGWIETNKKSNKNYFEEKYWTYFTYEELQNQTGVSKDTLRPVMYKLKKMGIVLIDNFNKRKNDRTNWYSLSNNYKDIIHKEDKIEIINSNVENDHIDCLNQTHPIEAFDTTLPYNNSEVKTNIKNLDQNDSQLQNEDKLEEFVNQIRKYIEPDVNSPTTNEDDISTMVSVLSKKHEIDKIVLILYYKFTNTPYNFYGTQDEITLIDHIIYKLKKVLKL